MNKKAFAYSAVILASAAVLLPRLTITYGVEAANQGAYGVLLLQVGERTPKNLHNYYSKVGIDFPIIAGLHPGIGGGTAVKLFRFQGYERRLPREVEVVWQLAELSDCPEKRWTPGEMDYLRCKKWVALPDRVYRRTLDLTPIRRGEAYRKSGKRNPDLAMSRYTLMITLIFNEGDLWVEAYNSATNPWQ